MQGEINTHFHSPQGEEQLKKGGTAFAFVSKNRSANYVAFEDYCSLPLIWRSLAR